MDIGTLIQDVIHTLSVVGWIGVLSAPAIWIYRKRYSLPWIRFQRPYDNDLFDLFLGAVTLVGLLLLHITDSI